MAITAFMAAYKRVWEGQNSDGFAALFRPDGRYHNTPFDVQVGHDAMRAYWDRIKLQRDIALDYEILSDNPGIAHWHVTYQVASEELFAIWAASAGTGLPARQPGDPLPRMALDGMLSAEFDADGLAREVRIWWHSQPIPPGD